MIWTREAYARLREVLKLGQPIFDPRDFRLRQGPDGRQVGLRRKEFDPVPQFKIGLQPDGDVRVSAGTVMSAELFTDAAGEAVMGITPFLVTALAAFTPAISTNYGVWVQLTMATPGTIYPPLSGTAGDLQGDNISAAAIVTSTTYTTAAQVNSICAANTGKAFVWIGQVSVDGSGTVTITQDILGPLHIPLPTYLTNLVSTDSNNGLAIGTDGNLMVKVVSSDANNQITFSGGGAFLRVQGGTAISVDETTPGQPQVDNDGVTQLTDSSSNVNLSGSTGHITVTDGP